MAQQRAQDAEKSARKAMEKLQQALSDIAETRQTARGLIVNVPDVLFDFDQATLRPEGRERLSKIAGIVIGAGAGPWSFTIEGHTDNVGTAEYNQRLSEQRAETVTHYLTAAGVPRTSIAEVRGLGESQPIASNETSQGRQRNRRVEILIQAAEPYSD